MFIIDCPASSSLVDLLYWGVSLAFFPVVIRYFETLCSLDFIFRSPGF